MTSNGDSTITRLMYETQVLKAVIDDLASKLKKMEVDFKVRHKIAAVELAEMEKKCDTLQRRVKELEAANPPSDVKLVRLQNALGPLSNGNELLRGENEMNDSKSAESAREPGHRGPIASSDNGCKNAYDKTAYSSAVASVAGLDGHPPRTIVDRVAQRSAQAVNATNASEDKNANNYVPATAPKDLEKAADDNKNTSQVADIHFPFGPICALQELCMARKWPPPTYEFYEEGDKKVFTYTVECTVSAFTVRVQGLIKKLGKRQAAAFMYYKLKNLTSIHEYPRGEKSNANVPETKLAADGMFGVGAAAGLDKVPALAAFVNAPASLSGDGPVRKVNEVATIETSKDVANRPASLAEHDRVATNEIPERDENLQLGSPLNEPVRDEQSPSSPAEHVFDFASRIRKSNNPSVRALKEMRAIDVHSMASCIEFLGRIEEEEKELTFKYEIVDSSALPIRNNFATVVLSVNPGALKVVGYGPTPFEGQEEAARACLNRFKKILKE